MQDSEELTSEFKNLLAAVQHRAVAPPSLEGHWRWLEEYLKETINDWRLDAYRDAIDVLNFEE